MNVNVLYVLEHKTSKKNPACLSVYLSGCLAVRTWILAVDTITFEGVSGSKQNLAGVYYVWNVGLILESKVKSWSWSAMSDRQKAYKIYLFSQLRGNGRIPCVQCDPWLLVFLPSSVGY